MDCSNDYVKKFRVPSANAIIQSSEMKEDMHSIKQIKK